MILWAKLFEEAFYIILKVVGAFSGTFLRCLELKMLCPRLVIISSSVFVAHSCQVSVMFITCYDMANGRCSHVINLIEVSGGILSFGGFFLFFKAILIIFCVARFGFIFDDHKIARTGIFGPGGPSGPARIN